jgi:phosphatidylinositol glycan class O
MESGEIFTPLSDITGQTGAARAPKPQQQQEAQPQVPAPRATITDPDKAKKIGQVHFKAAHGIILAFFTFILYVSPMPRTQRVNKKGHG